MQKSLRFRIILVILLLVITVAGGIWYTQQHQSDQAPQIVLPRGVTWGMTFAQVKTQETQQKVSYFEAEKPDRLIYKATLSNYPAALGYTFTEQHLTQIQFTALRPKGMTPEEYLQPCREEFTGLQQYFSQRFGPASQTLQTPDYYELVWSGRSTDVQTVSGNQAAYTLITLRFDRNQPLWMVGYQPVAQPAYVSAEDALNDALQRYAEKS